MGLYECMIMQFNTKNKCNWCCAVIEVDIMKVQREYMGENQDKWSDKMIFDWKNMMILDFFNDCIWFEQNLGAFIAKCPKSTCSVYNLLLSLGPSIPWCWWSRMAPDELMLSHFVLDFIPDVRPITLPIWPGMALFTDNKYSHFPANSSRPQL